MQRRMITILVFASVVGLVASLLVYRVLAHATARGPVAGSEPIVVATANLGLADMVTDAQVKLVAWPKQSIPEGALRTIDAATGRVVRTSLVIGEPLIEAKLAPGITGRGGIMPMLVPEGRRGVTIRVDDAIKESGFVLPNSRVDIVVSMARAHSQEHVAKVILQDVPVLAAGQTVEMRDNKPVKVTTVTLALTPEEAERLALAQNNGKLTLATRNLRDSKLVQTRGVTPAALLAGSQPQQPAAPAPKIQRASTPVVRLDNYSISVLRGSKVSEEKFKGDDPVEQGK